MNTIELPIMGISGPKPTYALNSEIKLKKNSIISNIILNIFINLYSNLIYLILKKANQQFIYKNFSISRFQLFLRN